jgi:hypothetical protein
MKLYVKPQIDVVELRPEERLAWTYTVWKLPCSKDKYDFTIHSEGTDFIKHYSDFRPHSRDSIWSAAQNFVRRVLSHIPGFR